jgi:hypothetical protein
LNRCSIELLCVEQLVEYYSRNRYKTEQRVEERIFQDNTSTVHFYSTSGLLKEMALIV